ncbi:MAG TPA: molybdenum cofactor guanylyltransferase [Acidimicrobiia bacterium]|nr:molybdenum cofactor guanylyltransferase [Acidimicrobiia bacterium]
MAPVLGVVVAGGAGTRMGRDKALVSLDGRPLIAWVVDALEAVCPRVLVAGRVSGWEGRRGIEDLPGVRGPLAGLAAALGEGEEVLLLAVDQPWAKSSTLAALGQIVGTAVPVDEGVRQVTCAHYSPSLASVAATETARGGSLQSLLDQTPVTEVGPAEWESWDEDGRSWFSVDTPADLRRGRELFGAPGT